MPLYEVAILETVSDKDGDESTKLAFGPKAVVAADEKAAIVGALASGAPVGANPENLEVLVRPFVSS